MTLYPCVCCLLEQGVESPERDFLGEYFFKGVTGKLGAFKLASIAVLSFLSFSTSLQGNLWDLTYFFGFEPLLFLMFCFLFFNIGAGILGSRCYTFAGFFCWEKNPAGLDIGFLLFFGVGRDVLGRGVPWFNFICCINIYVECLSFVSAYRGDIKTEGACLCGWRGCFFGGRHF